MRSYNNIDKNLAMQQCKSIKTRTVGMKYFYEKEQIEQYNYQVRWIPGPNKQADYFTKRFPPSVHIKIEVLMF